MKKTLIFIFFACVMVVMLVSDCQQDIFTKYKLTVIADENGLTEPSGTIEVLKGEIVTIKGIPDTGFHFSLWESVGSSSGAVSDRNAASTTIALNNGDVTIKASFAENAYELSFENDGNGTTNKTEPIPVGHNEPIAIVAIPNPCYDFLCWTVSVGNPDCVIFGNPAAAQTNVSLSCGSVSVKANFKIKTHTLTLRYGTGGIITVPNVYTKTLDCGAGETITAKPDPGYVFKNWTVNGVGSATFDNAAASTTKVRLYSDCEIKANFCDDSSAPTGINASSLTVCSGSTTTLSVTGGRLGTGASWKWYTDSLTGVSIGSGSTITVTPVRQTTYFVRAEGICEPTGAASLVIGMIKYKLNFNNTYLINGVTIALNGSTVPEGTVDVECGIPSQITARDVTLHAPIADFVFTFKKWIVLRGEATFGNADLKSTTVTVKNGDAEIQPQYDVKML